MKFLAEAYSTGVYRGAWFETTEEAARWLEAQKADYTKITPRETVQRQQDKQDAVLRSMGAPKIQRWATGSQRERSDATKVYGQGMPPNQKPLQPGTQTAPDR